MMAALCLAGLAAVAADGATDLAALTEGVAEIAAPGIPGPVCVVGKGAFAVVGGRSEGVQAAMVAGGAAGAGRVVAFGHDGYLAAEAIATADTGRLWLNAVRWVGRGETPKIAVVQADELAAYLSGKGLAVTRMTVAELAPPLAEVQVVCVNAHHLRAPAQVDALAALLARGGGVVLAATGWGWVQLNPGQAINRDFLGNLLLAPAGLAFSAAMSERTSPKGFAVSADLSPYINVSAALDALLAQQAGTQALAPAEQKQISAILPQAARATNVAEREFLPRLDALLAGNTAPVIPTQKDPVRATDGLKRLVVSLQADRLARTPVEQVSAHPAAADFPGAVPADAPRVTQTVRVDTRVPRWHSTGLYAAPGERITVTVPAAVAGKGLAVRLGCHSDGLWQRPDWWRFPEITRSFGLKTATTTAAGAFGGLVYIEVPGGCTLGSVEVSIEGAVRAPLYMHGATTLEEWRSTIRAYPGPWAEIASDKVIITVPAEHIRTLDDPAELTVFWESVMDACADLAARERRRDSPERYVADRQISVGYMHSGYPIMTFLDAAPRFVNVQNLRAKGDWGMFHEMGHNHQSGDWTFGGTGEVTENLFSLYLLETCCPGAPVHEAASPASIAKRVRLQVVENHADFEKWKADPFTGLVMYIQLRQAFGWEAYRKVFAEYRALPAEQRPKTDDEKRDQWLVRMSRTVGRNLGPFFQAWGVPTSEAARAAVAELPAWLPEGFPPG
jgi:hypothetical protein